MRIVLSDHLRDSLVPRGAGDAAVFDAVMLLKGDVAREHKNRRTLRCEIDGRVYFAKIHRPASIIEILKNVLRLRWPVLTAEPEWRAIHRLRDLGVPTVSPAGFGVRRASWLGRESFVITESLDGMVHLDDVARSWSAWPDAARCRVMRAAIREMAAIARAMHGHGLNHRDFYLNHFMLRPRAWEAFDRGDALGLHVIDLHRVQIRRRVPRSMTGRDLSGLLFSALDAGITSRDGARFLRAYWGASWHERVRGERWFLRGVIRRAVRVYQGDFGRRPRLPVGLSSF
jgi:heptose I phosphotransferase